MRQVGDRFIVSARHGHVKGSTRFCVCEIAPNGCEQIVSNWFGSRRQAEKFMAENVAGQSYRILPVDRFGIST